VPRAPVSKPQICLIHVFKGETSLIYVFKGEKINLAKFNFVEKGGRGGQPVKDVVFLWLEQFSFVNIQTLHNTYIKLVSPLNTCIKYICV
jgi:hypothetical protein